MPIQPVPVVPVVDPTMADLGALIALGLIPDPDSEPDPGPPPTDEAPPDS